MIITQVTTVFLDHSFVTCQLSLSPFIFICIFHKFYTFGTKSLKNMASIKNNLTLTLSAAQAASQACEAKAKEIGVPMNIAVVDCSTNLLSFSR